MDKHGHILEKVFYSNIDKYGIIRLYNKRPNYTDNDIYEALAEYLAKSNSKFVLGGLMLGDFKGIAHKNKRYSEASMSEIVKAVQYLYYCSKDYDYSNIKSFEYSTPLADNDIRPYFNLRKKLEQDMQVRSLLFGDVKNIYSTSTFFDIRLLTAYSFNSKEECYYWYRRNQQEKWCVGFISEIAQTVDFSGGVPYFVNRKSYVNIYDDLKYNKFLVKLVNCKRTSNGVPIADINKSDSNYDRILLKLLKFENVMIIGNVMLSNVFEIVSRHKDLRELTLCLNEIKELNYESYNTPYSLINELKYSMNLYDLYMNNSSRYNNIFKGTKFEDLDAYKYIKRRLYDIFVTRDNCYDYLADIGTTEALEVKRFVEALQDKYNILERTGKRPNYPEVKTSNNF